MLGAGLCSFCTQCQLRAGKRARELVEEDGGAARANPVEKLHRRRKRTRNELRGNRIKKGRLSIRSELVTPPYIVCQVSGKAVPSLTCGGRLK